jgi:DNA-binding response OmpR family regulator
MNHEQVTKILVVDDEPHVCELLSRWLIAEGYSNCQNFCPICGNDHANGEITPDLIRGSQE